MKYILILILFIAIFNISSMYHKDFTYDEMEHYAFGERWLKGDVSLSMQKMPITALNALPIWIMEKFNVSISPEATRLFCRLPTILFSIILGIFIFLWSSSLYGIKSGILSLGLYAFCPNVLAHSGLVTNDIYCAALIFISSYFFYRYLNAPSLKKLVLVSVSVGIAQLTKNTALLLFLIIPVFYLFHRYVTFSLRKSEGQLAGTQLLKNKIHIIIDVCIFLFTVILIINLGYLFKDVSTPLKEYTFKSELFNSLRSGLPNIQIPLPRVFMETLDIGKYFNDTGGGHGHIYLLGRLSQFGWWYYYFVVLMLKLPIAFILLLALSALMSIKHIPKYLTKEFYLLCPIAIVLIFFSFFSTAQLGIRYILTIFPFMFVFAGKVVSVDQKIKPKPYKYALFCILVWYIFSSLSYYPHYLSYFNELIGDRKNMYKYLADSNVDWGGNSYYLKKYIEKNKDLDINVNPDRPTSGIIIVNVNSLVGVDAGVNSNKYRWLRENYKPIDQVAYSWLVFKVNEKEKNESVLETK
jgi:hypothetical protein